MALDSCWGISKTGAHLKSTSRGPVGKVVIYSLVSVDGFIAADQDQLGSLFGGYCVVMCHWWWRPAAPLHFIDETEAALKSAQQLAGDQIVEVATGDVDGQIFATGIVDEVRMGVVQGECVWHLRFQTRR